MHKRVVTALLLCAACRLGLPARHATASTAPVVNITSSAPATAAPGERYPYAFVCSNVNGGSQTGVVLTDRLPAGIEYVPGSASVVATYSGRTVTLYIGGLGPRSTQNVSFQVKVSPTATGGTRIANSNYMLTGRPFGSATGSSAVTEIKSVVAPAAKPREPAVGPGSVVYESRHSADPNTEIYMANADGSGERRLTTVAFDNSYPSLSPDGSQVAFYSSRSGKLELYVMRAGSENESNVAVQLTNSQGAEPSPSTVSAPAWSPNGQQIVYESAGANDSKVPVVTNLSPQGPSNRPIDIQAYSATEMQFSPDGTRLMGVSGDNLEIVYLKVNSNGLVTGKSNSVASSFVFAQADNVSREFPTWSPDGTQVCFDAVNLNPVTAQPAGAYNLYLIDVNSKRLTMLTNGTVDARRPTWSPDGTRIAYETTGAAKSSGGAMTTGLDTIASIKPLPVTGAGGDNYPLWVTSGSATIASRRPKFAQVSGAAAPAVIAYLEKGAYTSQLNAVNGIDTTVVRHGDNFIYGINYSIVNNSGATLPNVTLTDFVPEGADYVSGGDSSVFDSSHVDGEGFSRRGVVFNLGPVEAGGSLTGFAEFTVKVTGAAGTTLTDATTDYYAFATGQKLYGNNDVITQIQGTPLPQLFINKIANVGSVAPNSQIIYTMTYGNTGPAGSSSQTLATDDVPTGTSFVSAHFVNAQGAAIGAYDGNITRPTVGGNGRVTYQLGALAAGQTSGIKLQLTVKVGSDKSSVSNTANIGDAGTPNAAPAHSNTVTTTVNIPKSPDLFIQKSANINSVKPGGQIIYTMTYGNRAGASASSANTNGLDALPNHTTFVSAHFVNAQGVAIPAYESGVTKPTAGTPVVTYKLGVLQPGQTSAIFLQLTVKVDASLKAGDAANIQNAAAIVDLGTNGGGPKTSNTIVTPLTFPPAAPSLFIIKSANVSSVKPGGQIVYTMTYGDSAGAAASSSLTGATDIIPTGTTYVSAHFVNSAGQTYSQYEGNLTEAMVDSKQQVTWNLGALQPGVTGVVFLQLTVKVNEDLKPSQQPNIANSASIFDLNVANSTRTSNTVTTPVVVTPPRPANLWIGLMTPPLNIGRGQTVAYIVSYGNSGDLPANNVAVRTRINLNQVNLPANPIDDGGTLQKITTGDTQPLIVWLLDSVPAHSMGTLTFRVQVKPGKTVGGTIDLNSIEILVRTGHQPSPVLDTCFPSRLTIVSTSPVENVRESAVTGARSIQRRASSNQGTDILTAVCNAIGAVGRGIGSLVFGATQQLSGLAKAIASLGKSPVGVSTGHIDIINLSNGVTIIPNGNDTVQVTGPSSLILTKNGVHIVGQGGGNIVAQGGGNLITIVGVLGAKGELVNTNGSNVFASQLVAAIVAQGGGNLAVGATIVAQGGGNLVNTNGSNLFSNSGSGLAGPALAAAATSLPPTSSLQTVTGNGVLASAPTALLDHAGSLINPNGSNVTQPNGSTLVTSGNHLIGQDGSRLIGQDGNG